jgi:hypothetical protein
LGQVGLGRVKLGLVKDRIDYVRLTMNFNITMWMYNLLSSCSLNNFPVKSAKSALN